MYFGGDLARLVAHPALQHPRRRPFRLDIAGLRRGQQPLVVLHREFRVDRQHRPVFAAHRHDDGELDHVVAVRRGLRLLVSYAPGGRISSSIARTCVSPQPPRVFTLLNSRLMSPICAVTACTSPIAFCTAVNWSMTRLKLSLHLLFDCGVKLLVHGLVNVRQLRLIALPQFPQLHIEQLRTVSN